MEYAFIVLISVCENLQGTEFCSITKDVHIPEQNFKACRAAKAKIKKDEVQTVLPPGMYTKVECINTTTYQEY